MSLRISSSSKGSSPRADTTNLVPAREIERERIRDEWEERNQRLRLPTKQSKRRQILTASLSSIGGSSLNMIESTVAKS
ncbi:hypothetical protein ERO13_A05G102450v2 [Gossypium hirsutum]|uniref:Uncharacterized protein n=1 Tax=Gossypium darwinii TaxID=34276 RepID=A0A5D2GE19_GOSDA|nr:hypothetical protein ERO13_A05G102450v2 [Gossypium hirsutum]TYH16331.1 hypothetical protein ES288_A05G108800v1 [Gossypium darwinii]